MLIIIRLHSLINIRREAVERNESLKTRLKLNPAFVNYGSKLFG